MLANPILCEFDMDLLMAEFVWSLQQDTFILFQPKASFFHISRQIRKKKKKRAKQNQTK